jgi:SAM-dependent methyltransferase
MSQRELTAYDVAGHYDDAYFADLAARYRNRNRFARQRIANVFSLLPDLEGRVLLDLGCGMGTFTIEAAGKGAFAVGVDPAEPAVRAAAAVAVEMVAGLRPAMQAADSGAGPGPAAQAPDSGAGIRPLPGARFLRADAAVLPLHDGCADLVLAADLTEHLDDVTLGRILREAHRVLRPAGRLVLYTPDRQHLFERLRDRGIMKQDPSHIGVRSAAELAGAVEAAGFSMERSVWLPSHLPGLGLAERALARWVPLLRRRIGLVATPVRRGSP